MNKLHIICHMTTSLDGKVTGSFLASPACQQSIQHYYQIHRDFRADAFACGRITMEESFTGSWQPDYSAFTGPSLSREDYIAATDVHFFAVAFDRQGRLGWQKSVIADEDPGYDGAHIVEVLCENTPDANLAYFRSIGVSYIFAGKTDLDLPLALKKLHDLFNIKILLLEGGGTINGAFHQAGLINELSLVVAPVTAASSGRSLFETGEVLPFCLTDTQTLPGSTLWLRYQHL